MKISYKTKKLEKLLSDFSALRKKYGEEIARKIDQRLSELAAADNLSGLPRSARAHPLQPKSEARFSVDLSKHKHPTRLLFYADEEFDLEDYSSIKAVTIESVSKTHS